ncbi:superoxide dismutase[Cu-Zn] [Mycobacterium sp.]|uniref:superoxide dismutase[Cu-Zn] n=1 Tax=Mycobacterium sp. TaxID=1785 RepID=UPI003BAB8C9A
MPMLAGHRNVAAAATSVLSVATCVALLSACTPNQPPATSPGTTPSVWTGSPSSSGNSMPEQDSLGPQGLTTRLKAPDGTEVATAKFEFADGYATITIETTGVGQLTPGFHGVHIHEVGKCEPNSVAPTGGASGDFLSAGGHLHVSGHGTGSATSGDLSSLQVRQDGAATLVTTTDAFTMDDLVTGQKTAIIVHAGADNFANIPTDRYTQVDGTPGPDETTMSTGDAGKRVACGVIGAG